MALLLAAALLGALCGAAAAERGTHAPYMQGFEDGGFHPDAPLTRAQTAVFLGRLLDARPEAGAGFPDVSDDAWYAEAVRTLAARGILSGYPDGTFQPNQNVTRAEFVTLLTRVWPAAEEGRAAFTDTAGHWAVSAIGAAAAAGWINGYAEPDGGFSFRPDQSITRAEAVKVTNRAAKRTADPEMLRGMMSYPDVPRDAWYYADVMEASCAHTYESSGSGERWLEITGGNPLLQAVEATDAAQSSEQLVVVTGARLTAWDHGDDGVWRCWLDVPCGYGKNGMLDGNVRHEGDLTTPIGAYPLTLAFGTGEDPGTALPYRQITQNSYWSNAADATYNTWVERETPISGEHLADYPVQYQYAVAIGFNIDPTVIGRGSAIFLHCKSPDHWYTAGCVSVEKEAMLELLRQLRPGAYILIAPGVDTISEL